ncbi:hypothetical protein ACQPYH_28640 [Kribbella sp. CA-245084]|uniref:hypothetical protein n=1 Tax=Kribbella sp. CA-245084 TaxID=3239940 RepID=UPI003D949CE4
MIALILLAAVLIPYVGYRFNGQMPMIDNVRPMASTGLLFGGLAFWVIRGGQRPVAVSLSGPVRAAHATCSTCNCSRPPSWLWLLSAQ